MEQAPIRRAGKSDICRLAEIEIFNYRLNFYPIFQNDDFYFHSLQVTSLTAQYEADPALLENTWVWDDGAVKGFIRLSTKEIRKLFVEPVLQGRGIGAALLAYAVEEMDASFLWTLEKNARAIAFYGRHGFHPDGERRPEENTEEFLIRLTL